jgi:hypothetical protein
MAQSEQSAAKNSWAYAYRQAVTKHQEASEEMDALVAEFNARGFSGTIADEDLVGANAGMTTALISNAVGSNSAIQTMLDAGHRTNLDSVRVR